MMRDLSSTATDILDTAPFSPTMPRFTTSLDEVIAASRLDLSNYVYRLTSADRQSLEALAGGMRQGTRGDVREMLAVCAQATTPTFVERVRSINQPNNELGVFVFKDLPVDEITGFSKAGKVSELSLCLVAQTLGAAVGYSTQSNGALLGDIYPKQKDSYRQVGSNSSVDLLWHTEFAQVPLNPDFILLSCLRGDPNARTLVSCVGLNDLKDFVLETLQRPVYSIFADESFAEDSSSKIFPVLDNSTTPCRLRFDPLYTSSTSLGAMPALRLLNEHLNRRAFHLTLEPGDLLVIDNRRTVHARSAFTPRFDGTDRWLQRMLVLGEVPPEHALSAERIIDSN